LLILLALAIALAGCGYPGEPKPPSLSVPLRVSDLQATEYGDKVIVTFTIPALATDGLALTRVNGVELRVGPGVKPFDMARWLDSARPIEIPATKPGRVTPDIPAREWVGKEILLAVRVIGPKRRSSEWSNLGIVQVVEPLGRPAGLQPAATAKGVQLTWQSPEASFQVFRQGPEDKTLQPLERTQKPEYLDPAAEYGKTYLYSVQAFRDKAQSEASETVSITPADTFAPDVPAGLTAIAGASSIQLAWERNVEPDFKGYRIYRSVDGGPFAMITQVDTPTYSDRDVQTGKQYRYAISSIDQVGNESERTAAVEAALQ
jgi:hypothetical protein